MAKVNSSKNKIKTKVASSTQAKEKYLPPHIKVPLDGKNLLKMHISAAIMKHLHLNH